MDNPFPTETTPLANPQGDDEEGQQYQRRQDSLPSDTESNGSTGQSQLLWDELDAPWPSTFERSISLLASPGVARADVKAFTMSPKPGSTPLALQRRRTLGRGFYTPDASSALFVQQRTRRQGRAADDEDTEEAAWPSTRQNRSDRSHKKDGGAMTKMQSLDFGVQVVASTQAQLATKAQQAKEYRAQFLNASKLANSERDDDHLRSPGYAREVQSLRQKELAQQQNVDSHSVPAGSNKSTVLQSAFNLANILMGVGLLGLPFGFRVAGFGGAMICLTVFGGICWRTSILIGRELNGDYRPSSYFDDNPFKSPHPPGSPHGRLLAPITSFPDIARRAFGETGNLILSCLLYFELFSCICIFFVSIGDHLHSLFPAVGIKALTCLVAAISLVPSILLKTPTLLSYFSMVGTLATIVVVLTVVATAVMQGSVVEEMQEIQEAAGVTSSLAPYTAFDSSGLVLCLGLVAYCFSGHAIVPSIYSSMKEPQRFEEMVTWTFVVVMATCFAVVCTNERASVHPFNRTNRHVSTVNVSRMSRRDVFRCRSPCVCRILTLFRSTGCVGILHVWFDGRRSSDALFRELLSGRRYDGYTHLVNDLDSLFQGHTDHVSPGFGYGRNSCTLLRNGVGRRSLIRSHQDWSDRVGRLGVDLCAQFFLLVRLDGHGLYHDCKCHISSRGSLEDVLESYSLVGTCVRCRFCRRGPFYGHCWYHRHT
jgi:hypothetical protein